MGMLGDFICPDCGYRSSEVLEMVEAHMESHEAKQSSLRAMLDFPCPQSGSTTVSEQFDAKLKKMKLAGWIVLGIVIIALVYYLLL